MQKVINIYEKLISSDVKSIAVDARFLKYDLLNQQFQYRFVIQHFIFIIDNIVIVDPQNGMKNNYTHKISFYYLVYNAFIFTSQAQPYKFQQTNCLAISQMQLYVFMAIFMVEDTFYTLFTMLYSVNVLQMEMVEGR